MNDKRHGPGVYTWANGDRYSGNWVLGKMSGRGIKTMINGEEYDGEWADSKTHGFGLKRFPDGDRHAGQYRNDQRHGYGMYFYANGEKVRPLLIACCCASDSHSRIVCVGLWVRSGKGRGAMACSRVGVRITTQPATYSLEFGRTINVTDVGSSLRSNDPNHHTHTLHTTTPHLNRSLQPPQVSLPVPVAHPQVDRPQTTLQLHWLITRINIRDWKPV